MPTCGDLSGGATFVRVDDPLGAPVEGHRA